MNKQELKNWLESQYQSMVANLYALCEINSGSTNLTGLEKLHHLLRTLFTSVADTVEIPKLPQAFTRTLDGDEQILNLGEPLLIRKRPEQQRRILLCGHMDTVFAQNHPFQTLTPISDNKLCGPGVTDMKGGLIVMLYALLALEQLPQAKNLGWDVFINADEEIGSPSSGPFLESIAHQYQAGFVYEPTQDIAGTFVKNRKGSLKCTIVAVGKAAHAGRDFHAGRNAICLLAKVITAIDALNYKHPNISINIGLIKGGNALNIVPAKAVTQLDIRMESSHDLLWLKESLVKIIDSFQHPEYKINIYFHFSRPVKTISPPTQRLFNHLINIAAAMDLKVDWRDSGGCCDGNNLCSQGLPVIDTMGVRGEHIHTENETICLDSLVERSLLSALLFNQLALLEHI